MTRPERSCGDCSLCCKLYSIAELQKAPNVWCAHCTPGNGCQIHNSRPQQCRDFECLWLQGVLPEEAKPNKIKAVFGLDEDDIIQCAVDAGFSTWRTQPINGLINILLGRGLHVIVRHGNQRTFMPTPGKKLPEKVTKAFNVPTSK